jgi:hypothetical protein
MKRQELVEVALSVLKAWTSGERLPAGGVDVLRQHALPHEVDLSVDELACQIVRRECSRVIAESRQERTRLSTLATRQDDTGSEKPAEGCSQSKRRR